MTEPGVTEPGLALAQRLRQALRDALARRDMVAVRALRSALAAIANAEAVPLGQDRPAEPGSEHFAGARAGLGATEMARRQLGERQVRDIVRAEIDDRLAAAAQYEHAGHADRAATLRAEADVLQRQVGAAGS